MSLNELIDKMEQEAKKGPFPVDADIYKFYSRDEYRPILYAGNLNAKIGLLARDLGKEEVMNNQPLIGTAGQLVRRNIYEHINKSKPPKDEIFFYDIMNYVMFTNLVPFKPIGNKVFPEKVRKRFAPYIAEFLIEHWKGNFLITLGTEAFKWLAYFCDNVEKLSTLWQNEETRYIDTIKCNLTVINDGNKFSKEITIAPLPHPSPLNVKWYKKFPDLLKGRLSKAMDKIS